MTEYFDVLDANGNKTGITKERIKVHRDGDWHRSVHIWIVNAENKILLQKRSHNKDSMPDMWDISSAGHLCAGDDSVNAALREIKEELGISFKAEDLCFLATIKSEKRHSANFMNREFSDVYIVFASPEKFTLQTEEVAAVKWVSVTELKKMITLRDTSLVLHERDFLLLFDAIDKR